MSKWLKLTNLASFHLGNNLYTFPSAFISVQKDWGDLMVETDFPHSLILLSPSVFATPRQPNYHPSSATHHPLKDLRWPGPVSRFAIYVSTISTKKWYNLTISTQPRYVLTDSTQAVYVSTTFDRGRTFSPSSTENISTSSTEKKTFRPSSTEEKRFDRVRPRSFIRREECRPRQIISTVFDRGKTFWLSLTKGFLDRKVFDRSKKIRQCSTEGIRIDWKKMTVTDHQVDFVR